MHTWMRAGFCLGWLLWLLAAVTWLAVALWLLSLEDWSPALGWLSGGL